MKTPNQIINDMTSKNNYNCTRCGTKLVSRPADTKLLEVNKQLRLQGFPVQDIIYQCPKCYPRKDYKSKNEFTGLFLCPHCKKTMSFKDGDYCPHCNKRIGITLKL